MQIRKDRIAELEKIAYGFGPAQFNPTVGISNPPPTVGDVLSAIGVAQARGIGTQSDRTDAFGRIINSGLTNSSPASNALRMIGGGILGRTITGAFTNNPLLKGIGTGLGSAYAIRNW